MVNKLVKKIFIILLLVVTSLSMLGCNKEQDNIKIYAPDGAPALALANSMAQNFKGVEYNIIDSAVSANIGSFVTGKNPLADICILPINIASNMLGSGEEYKMLGTITHGNFYFLSTNNTQITVENLSNLVGKKVGVMQLNNVPGQALKIILNEKSIPYTENSNTQNDNAINLVGISKSEVIVGNYDYFLIPSPLADVKANTTSLNIVGSLQGLYGEGGFPQAVVVCKNKLLNNNLTFVKKFCNALKDSNNFLIEENIESICSLIESNLPKDTNPTFTKNNLTIDIINNSSINFIASKDCKQEVVDFSIKLNIITNGSSKIIEENFFYMGEL